VKGQRSYNCPPQTGRSPTEPGLFPTTHQALLIHIAVPGPYSPAKSSLPLADWRLGPPKSLRGHAAQRHQLQQQLTTEQHGCFSLKHSLVQVGNPCEDSIARSPQIPVVPQPPMNSQKWEKIKCSFDEILTHGNTPG